MKWRVLPVDEQAVASLRENLGLSSCLARLLAVRGITEPAEARDFLFGGKESLSDPMLLPDMALAVRLIRESLDSREKILVFGDYDADGVTAAALLTSLLRKMGGDVLCYIPHRLDEGYGLSAEGIEEAQKNGVRLIVTVDCGSSDGDEIALAHSYGIKVVVTDHHQVDGNKSGADACVNPHRPDSACPFRDLAGAGVALALARALDGHLWEESLDLAAIGTVADVVPLLGENRIIARLGLMALQEKTRPGLKALLQEAGVETQAVGSWHVGFVIAPRINAAGRISSAETALELLLEENPSRAAEMAVKLNELNTQRQKLDRQIRQEIQDHLAGKPKEAEESLLFMASPTWHPGVIGIVAGKLSDERGKPVFLLSIQDGEARGSARGCDGYDVFRALSDCREHLTHFGGHPGAGGFSLPEKDIGRLKEALLARSCAPPEEKALLPVDMELSLEKVNFEILEDLQRLSPFGEGNPEPLFLSRKTVLSSLDQVGARKQHLRFRASQRGKNLKAIWFDNGERLPDILPRANSYDLIHRIEEDNWNGRKDLVLKIKDVIESPRGNISSSPSRETLGKVYRVLTKLSAKGTWFECDERKLATTLQDDMIVSATVRVALRIFEEIGILDSQASDDSFISKLKLREGVKGNLSDSATYQSLTSS
ncbi:MAG: single-stranded-DNA-specific exonuclease RecJ [bacterium]